MTTTVYSTNVQTLLAALASPGQDISDALAQLLTQRALDTAVGAQLDQVGTILNQARAGAVDDVYRRYLNAKIAVDRSRGNVADVYKVARAILGVDSTEKLEVKNEGCAALVLLITNGPFRDDGTVDIDAEAVLQTLLRNTVSAGVRIIEEIAQATDDDTFFTPYFTVLSGAHTAGATAISATGTNGFPDTGSLIIDEGLAVAETVTYSGRLADGTGFTGVSALAHNHVDQSGVTSVTPGKGLGNSSDASVGGRLASAQD